MAKKKNRQQDPDESSDSGATRDTASSGCSHISKAVDLGSIKKKMKSTFSVECHACAKGLNSTSVLGTVTKNEDPGVESTMSLWLCLRCGHVGCGRLQAKHALEHCNSPHSDSHAMVVDIESWTVWCYKCEQQMSYKATKKLQECIEYIRRHLPHSASIQSAVTTPNHASHGRSALNAPASATIVEFPVGSAEQNKTQAKDFSLKKLKSQRVRGLINLGNTCFYNSVLQCLSVTPFLATVLQRLTETGEKFLLPGDPNSKEVELLPVEGELGESGVLTKSLLSLLMDMRSSTLPADTLRPANLLKHVQDRYPLFQGYEQHDAHELLRHLLEGVRSDDLKRYQHVLLKQNGLSKSSNPDRVDQHMRKRMKLYGLQLQELTLGVEGIFKGQLVSILECQDCRHLSIRFENFLDLSLPVAEDKPLPPMRKKENQDSVGNDMASKYQHKKEKKEARRRKVQRRYKMKSDSPDHDLTIPEENMNGQDGDASEQSDADVEDNVEQDSLTNLNGKEVEESGYSSEKHHTGESVQTSPSITNMDVDTVQNLKVSAGEDCIWEEYYTPTHTKHHDRIPSAPQEDSIQSQFHTPEHPCTNGHCQKSTAEEENRNCGTPEDEQLSITIPEGAGKLLMHMSPVEPCSPEGLVAGSDLISEEIKHTSVLSAPPNEPKVVTDLEMQLQSLHVNEGNCATKEETLGNQVNGLVNNDRSICDSSKQVESRIEQKDIIFWCKTMAAKQQTEDGECSVTSCLNQFTSLELMTGNNKVGCDACTQRINKGKEGKTVYTNSTKQLLISSPPAVMILHLKRFMMENFRFRKLQRYVSFPLELDIAPFCSNKCKDLPSISQDQTEVRYTLFGVVEHTGSLNTGHYVAYIKIRTALGETDPRWSFLPQTRDFVYSQSKSHDESASMGIEEKWYCISDSRVVETAEAKVLKTQAYLLFYERIV